MRKKTITVHDTFQKGYTVVGSSGTAATMWEGDSAPKMNGK